MQRVLKKKFLRLIEGHSYGKKIKRSQYTLLRDTDIDGYGVRKGEAYYNTLCAVVQIIRDSV